MSSLFGFFRSGRSRRPFKHGEAPGLGAALRRLFEEASVEVAPAKGAPRRGRRGRAASPALDALDPTRWAQECARPGGEIIYLRSGEDEPLLAILARGTADPGRDSLASSAAALALIAEKGGFASEGWFLSAQAADAGALAFLSCRVGGGRSFSARGSSLLIHVDEALAAAIESALESGDLPLDEIAGDEPSSLALPSSLVLRRSQDFAFAHFFLPPSFLVGGAPVAGSADPVPGSTVPMAPLEVSVFWNSMSVGEGKAGDLLIFAGSLGEAKAGIALVFECAVPGGVDRASFSARILPVLREGWARATRRLAPFAPQGSTPRFGALASVPAALLAGSARVAGELRLGQGGFPVAVRITPRFAAILASSLKTRPANFGAPSILADILSINEALLGRWGLAVRDSYLKPRTPPGSRRACGAAPLASLLGALGPRDATVALQNCLLPRYGATELPYLFFFHAPFVRNGKRAMRPQALAPFLETEITRLLPPTAREEWEQERRFDLPRRTIPPEDCASGNDEASRLIWEAARAGRLEFSPGSRALLEERVGKRLQEAAKAELSALADKDIPFGFLASLAKADSQRIVDRIPNKELALAAVGDDRHIDLLRSCMGAGRKRDFDEEIELARARIERGELGVEKAAAMKLALLSQMKERAEDLKRERAASN